MNFEAMLREAIKEAITAGARPDTIAIYWSGMEWRFSPVTRRWERYA